MNYALAMLCNLLVFVGLSSATQSCAHRNKPATPAADDSRLEQLRGAKDGWLAELKAVGSPNTGWFGTDCDGTLWVGEAVAAGHPAQLQLAEYPAGVVHRRPETMGECYPKESHATTSPDMRLGYMLGTWALGDGSALERLAIYGRATDWVVGEPHDDASVLMRPTEIGLLFRAIVAAGVPFETNERDKIGLACLPVASDYEFHIQTLGILLDGEIAGGVSDICLEALRRNATDFPGDALLLAALGVYTGDFDQAVGLLLDPDYSCPSYVRPVAAYCTIHKAYAASVILRRFAPQEADG